MAPEPYFLGLHDKCVRFFIFLYKVGPKGDAKPSWVMQAFHLYIRYDEEFIGDANFAFVIKTIYSG